MFSEVSKLQPAGHLQNFASTYLVYLHFSLEIDLVFNYFKDRFFLDKFKDRAGKITHDETQTRLLDLQKTFIVVEGRVSYL